MKKLLTACCLAVSLFLIGSVSASAATYVYTLDVDIIDPGLITVDDAKIGFIQFQVAGGTLGSDWDVVLGDAVPSAGNWIFENFGSWNTLYDDYNYSLKDYAPMISGNALTINSDVQLDFSNLGFFDFRDRDLQSGYFVTDGFVEQSPVPVPSGIVLLGSGLIGLFGLARRKG